jgi:hypothetical protein
LLNFIQAKSSQFSGKSKLAIKKDNTTKQHNENKSSVNSKNNEEDYNRPSTNSEDEDIDNLIHNNKETIELSDSDDDIDHYDEKTVRQCISMACC